MSKKKKKKKAVLRHVFPLPLLPTMYNHVTLAMMNCSFLVDGFLLHFRHGYLCIFWGQMSAPVSVMWTQVSVVSVRPNASRCGLTRAKERSVCNRRVRVYCWMLHAKYRQMLFPLESFSACHCSFTVCFIYD